MTALAENNPLMQVVWFKGKQYYTSKYFHE
jgi:hypothetical protein